MQLKCPGCARTLKIPDTAAGKVVKCPCGKQLRAPGGSPVAQPKTPPRKANAPAKTGAPSQKPQAAPSGPSAFGVDENLFDELTEGDMKPVMMVATPGASAVSNSKGAEGTLAKAGADLDKKQQEEKSRLTQGSAKEVRSSIGILLLLGIARLIIGILFMAGSASEAQELSTDPAFEGEADGLQTILRIIYGFYIATGLTFLGCAGLIFKFPMTCAITAIVTYVLGEIIGLVMFPFGLFSIRGWIARAAVFGALVQCINNAAYYKFVKEGGTR